METGEAVETEQGAGENSQPMTSEDLRAAESGKAADRYTVGVGPHGLPWPDDPRLDPKLLAEGDRRNVVDRYRYWQHKAIVEDLKSRRHPFHVAIENWRHDLNIGAAVRNANAFGAQAVHIVGRRRWNRRGAMVTDRYQDVRHHERVSDLKTWAEGEDLEVVGIDNLPGAVALETNGLPLRCVLFFGQEGPGLSPEAVEVCDSMRCISQFGSTRSINAGVASGIAMYAWVLRHVFGEEPAGAQRRQRGRRGASGGAGAQQGRSGFGRIFLTEASENEVSEAEVPEAVASSAEERTHR